MKALILGCGPAGLMAAQGVVDACLREGITPHIQIASRKKMSPLYGAQYLHRPIPGFTVDKTSVSYQLRGDVDGYRLKVYGPMWSGTVSPEDLLGEHMAWDIRHTYRRLWAEWNGNITDMELAPVVLQRLVEGWDIIINSVPRASLCHEGHHFGATEVWAAGDAPELGINIGNLYMCPESMVVCNGSESPAWYRMSRVFGHTTVEWPGNINLVPVKTAARVRKPTKTDCTCWPQIKHVGRYGTWSKGVLSHEAYFDAMSQVEKILGVGSVTAAKAGS